MLPERARESLRWARSEGYERPFPMSYRSFSAYWEAMRVAVFPDEVSPTVAYVLRHTCCSRLVQNGVDIRRVKDWMGHSSIQTTMRYAHLAPGDLEVCASVLNEVPWQSGDALACKARNPGSIPGGTSIDLNDITE